MHVQFKGCCFFVSIFLLFIATIIAVVALLVIFVLKPQEPRFSFDKISVNSYKLSVFSNSTLFISSFVSLVFNAQNHNKFGLHYSCSWFQLHQRGVPIGLIRFPEFYQPPHSDNISVTTNISLPCVNATEVLGESLSQKGSKNKNVEMKILGDLRVSMKLLHLKSPAIKVRLTINLIEMK